MSAPHYFLPQVYRAQLLEGGKLSRALLESRGLLPIFGDVTDLVGEVAIQEMPGSGPGGASGTMLVPLVPGGEPPVRLGYHPDRQDWHQIGDAYWLGIDRECPPMPIELTRRKTIGGYWMELGDGQLWAVPILRRPNASTELPCSFGWDAGGRFQETVRGDYRQLWEDTGEIVEWFLSGQIRDLPFVKENLPRIIDWCVRILAVNYRFDRVLQTHLAPIGSQDWALLLGYAIDWATAQALDSQKKTDPESANEVSDTPSSEPANISPGSAEVVEEITAPAVAS